MKKLLAILVLALSLSACAPMGTNCYCPTGAFYCEDRSIIVPHPAYGYTRSTEKDCFCHKPLVCSAVEEDIPVDRPHGRW